MTVLSRIKLWEGGTCWQKSQFQLTASRDRISYPCNRPDSDLMCYSDQQSGRNDYVHNENNQCPTVYRGCVTVEPIADVGLDGCQSQCFVPGIVRKQDHGYRPPEYLIAWQSLG